MVGSGLSKLQNAAFSYKLLTEKVNRNFQLQVTN